jgi:hypothetical protein
MERSLFEERINPEDAKMKLLGFTFLSNYEVSRVNDAELRLKAINAVYKVSDKAYTMDGRLLPTDKAVYVLNGTNLEDFWK